MASDPSDGEFRSTLDEASRKRAREELGELNDKDRELAVQSLRQWVLQQPWLKIPTDFGYLLRFLRVRKFSQLGARATLENYWTARTKIPQWFKNIDPADPVLVEILNTGFYFCPKKTDNKGRRQLIEQPRALDMNVVKKKWGLDNVFKAIVLVCEWLNRDENIQVNGMQNLYDMGDSTLSHGMKVWSPENSKRIMQYYQKALPTRIKGIHVYNEPAFVDVLWAIVSPVLTPKMKNRFFFHGRSLTKVYEHMDMSVLPDEYLPDEYEGPSVGPSRKIIDEMIEDMQKPEFRAYMKNLTGDKYGVDLKLKEKTEIPENSFRKLNV